MTTQQTIDRRAEFARLVLNNPRISKFFPQDVERREADGRFYYANVEVTFQTWLDAIGGVS